MIKSYIKLWSLNAAGSYPANDAGSGREVGKTNRQTPDESKLQKVGLPRIRWGHWSWKWVEAKWYFSSFVVKEFDFNLFLGSEANSSAGPQTKLLAFQVIVLECKVHHPFSCFINITSISDVSRTFPIQTVVGLASSAPLPTPMWGLP